MYGLARMIFHFVLYQLMIEVLAIAAPGERSEPLKFLVFMFLSLLFFFFILNLLTQSLLSYMAYMIV
jgi:hypothetical protein